MSRKHEIRPLSSDVVSGNIGGVLAKLFRIIMRDLCINDERFHSLVARYIRVGELQCVNDGRKSLDRELLKVVMTWKTYLRSLDPIKVHRSVFSVKLWPSDDESDCVYTAVSISTDRNTLPGAYLSELLIRAYMELGIHGQKYDELMDRYVLTTRSIVHQREKSSIRAALSKELFSPEITWRTYIKGLMLVQIKKIEIAHKLKHSRTTTTHTLSVVLDELGEEE